MAARDVELRSRLAQAGELHEGYSPQMEALHIQNGERLAAIIETRGWPGRTMVGSDAADAAWLVLQHAISLPQLQRRGLELLAPLVDAGEVRSDQLAMLEDRIAVFEGRGQRFGTQFDWDEHGELSPEPIEDPSGVDERRAAVGLPPLAETTARHRREAEASGEGPPSNPTAKRALRDAWLRRVGWRR